ncbi:MAG TPA: RpoL/Rpb11 RNA polymerase subunit family protein [Candidatus Bathyarchaeia archaeon]|nr:RpoL/Rpb11 RNA polymerase subunit family protein [Candidatus Bathyarchaeia archaeon]
MKVKVLKRAPDELKLEIEGIGHTLCNLLQKRILEEAGVDLAGYDIPHPMSPVAMIYVRTKGKTKPEGVLKQAADRARELNKEFGKEFEKALKKA